MNEASPDESLFNFKGGRSPDIALPCMDCCADMCSIAIRTEEKLLCVLARQEANCLRGRLGELGCSAAFRAKYNLLWSFCACAPPCSTGARLTLAQGIRREAPTGFCVPSEASAISPTALDLLFMGKQNTRFVHKIEE